MGGLKSLSAKIIAVIFLLVGASYIADFTINSFISHTVKKETDSIVKTMQSVLQEKDRQISQGLSESLALKEERLNLAHSVAASSANLKITEERNFLKGTQFGISSSVATLIETAMMAGEAGAVQDVIETMTGNDKILSINLWRTDGVQAFKDNQTIDAVNRILGGETFAPREVEEPAKLQSPRMETLLKAVESRAPDVTLNGAIETDGETVPATYSYFVLENKEVCQGCHGENDIPRGVIELATSRADLIKMETDAEVAMTALNKEQEAEAEKVITENKAFEAKIKQTSAKYAAEMQAANKRLEGVQSDASTWSVGAKVGFFIVTALVIFTVLRSLLTRPLTDMTEAMGKLAHGELETEVPSTDRTDEIGRMAAAVQVFKDNALKVKNLTVQQEEAKKKAAEEQAKMRRQLADRFETSVGGVVETVGMAASTMKDAAQTMSGAAKGTEQRSSAVASAAENAANNVQSVASAAEEMSASINEISTQVHQSTQIAAEAVGEAKRTETMVKGLDNAAEKIGEVVQLITDIAEQTNLLALNATIEAARAGEAGKGFAVVASEVKNLANQTAKATEEISLQVGGIQNASQETVQAIAAIGKIIDRMNEIASSIASAMEQQSAATQEIARSVEMASVGTSEVSGNISTVTQSVKETGIVANQVLDSALEIGRQSDLLNEHVAEFLDQIRKG